MFLLADHNKVDYSNVTYSVNCSDLSGPWVTITVEEQLHSLSGFEPLDSSYSFQFTCGTQDYEPVKNQYVSGIFKKVHVFIWGHFDEICIIIDYGMYY